MIGRLHRDQHAQVAIASTEAVLENCVEDGSLGYVFRLQLVVEKMARSGA